MSKAAEPWSARQQRQLSYISEFTTDTTGKSNLVADCFFRAAIGAIQLGLDYTRMAADQTTDPSVQTFKAADTGLHLEDWNGLC